MKSESKYYQKIINRLEITDRKEYLRLFLQGLINTGLISVSVFVLLSLVEMIFNFSSLIRTVLFFCFLMVIFSAFFYWVLIPASKYFRLFTKRNYFETAAKVGNYFPEIKDDLKNVMQLVAVSNTKLYSSVLVDAAFRSVYNKTSKIRFDSLVKFNLLKKPALRLVALVVFTLMLLLVFPGFSGATSRFLQFDQEFIPPARFQISVIPGNTEVTKGSTILITIKVNGDLPANVSFYLKDDEQTNFTQTRLTADSLSFYIYEIKSVRNSFNYYVTADEVKSELFRIEVVDRPIIKTISFRITPPAYSKIPSFEQKDNGNITALIGSRIDISLSSTKDLISANIEFDDTTRTELTVNKNLASGNIRIRKETSYRVSITDDKGNQNLNPITYIIKPVYDAVPSIELISPGRDIPLANDNRVPLFAKISDDFGFTKLLLHYRLARSRYEIPQDEFSSVEIPIPASLKEADINYVWNLTRLSPAVDDIYSYYLEVFDNDNVSGPKSAKTPIYNVRVPSLDEILAGVDQMQNEAVDELSKTLQEAEQLKKDLEKIDQEMKQDRRELTWEEKEKIEQALDKFEQLQDKMSDIQQNLQKMQQDLQQNNLLSQETLEKYMELQELMSELTSDDFKKAMEKLRDMLEQMNRNMTQNEMQNFKLDEERFRKSIERTLNLLKRIQIEQKFDEMMKRTEQLTEQQEQLSEQTKQSEQNNNQNSEQLSKKQDEITDQLDKLSENMEELADKMNELDDMPSEEMRKLLEEFMKQMNEELSKQASQNMKQKQMQKAQQNQQQLSQNMQQMKDMLQQMKDMMMQQNQMQVFTDMMRIMDNLLRLSQQQEELKKESERLDPNSAQFNENAQKQNNLKLALNRLLDQLSNLSQKTFAVSPEMGKALGSANQQMDASIQAMQNRNGAFAALTQSEAMKHLNEAASMMKNSMESMMQSGGSGGGMMSLMQQLQQMSGQQMSLNNLTQQLQQMMQGGLSPGQQAELQRLGQQQDLISKSLEQLNEEARISGQSKRIPADLENIVKQMQEVVSDMKTEKLDDDLIQKQERILSRLLDAQRSINERDFEKERKSETGQQIARQSPAELDFNSNTGRNTIRDELNRAVREGYRRDFEDLIRRYYEALQKQEINN